MNLSTLIEFIKITIISLEQDLEELATKMDSLDMNSKDFAELDIEYNFISGRISGMRYILASVESD